MEKKMKILVVDDEPSVRSLLKRLLGADYTVVEATNGKEALAMARQEKPSLILMDILMPEMDGLTACYTLKLAPETRDIPVLMLSALDFELNRKLSRDVMGADGYLTKPFDAKELLGSINRYLAKASSARTT